MKRHHLLLIPTALALLACSKSGGPQQGGGGGGFAVPVRVALAARQPLEEKISLVATLSANEAVDIQSRIGGAIAKIHFQEGEAVEEGRPLFDLDTGKLEASVAQAEANLKMMQLTRERSENMLKNNTISQQEFDQAIMNSDAATAAAELAKQQLKDAHIRAEFGGIMGARQVSVGQVVEPQTILSRLVDIDPMKVEFRVPERFLRDLKVGQTVEFKVAAYPETPFKGEVYFIDPQLDLVTRTILVKARCPNPDQQLRPGMFGNLDLITRIRDNAVIVPETAIVMQGDHATLFVVDAEKKAQPKAVEIGTRMAGRVEIASGLDGGETVIVEGVQKVRPGAPVMAQPADAPAGS